MTRLLQYLQQDTIVSQGIARLMFQPSYIARVQSEAGIITARYYRRFIFLLTFLIILLSLVPYVSLRYGGIVLCLSLTSFVAYTLLKWRYSTQHPDGFYRSSVQLLRAQLGIVAITGIIWYLAFYTIAAPHLSLLYILPILIVSEHSDSRTVALVWLEVSLLTYVAIASGLLLSNGDVPLHIFASTAITVTTFVLYLTLLTFLCRYLQINIQGRQRTYVRLTGLLDLINQHVVVLSDPIEQRIALLELLGSEVNATANVWMQRLSDDEFVDLDSNVGNHLVKQTVTTQKAVLVMSKADRRTDLGFQVCIDESLPVDTQALLLLPVFHSSRCREVIAVIGLSFKIGPNSMAWFDVSKEHLKSLAQCSSSILQMSIMQSRKQLIDQLTDDIYRLLDSQQIAEHAVSEAVKQLGFDFATISLVDMDHQVIKSVAGKNAGWEHFSSHPLALDDIQSWVVRHAMPAISDGSFDPRFNVEIYTKFDHAHCSRLWIPLLDPHAPEPREAVLGTIEAGFWHCRRSTITEEHKALLENYASSIGNALGHANQYEKQTRLTRGLTALHKFGDIMHRRSMWDNLGEISELIGRHAEERLKADFVILYTIDDDNVELQVSYASGNVTDLSDSSEAAPVRSQTCPIPKRTKPFFAPDAERAIRLLSAFGCASPSLPNVRFKSIDLISFTAIPLIGHARNNFGWLCLGFGKRHQFDSVERQIIELFVRQAAIELERAQVVEKSRRAALDHERASFAAKMHDRVSQTLFALECKSVAANGYLEQNKICDAQVCLHEATTLASVVRTDFHDMLVELKAPPRIVADFVQEMDEHIERMTRSFSTPISFESQIPSTPVPNHVQFYLLRIAREALNNALRHGRGAAVTISYGMVEGEDLVVVVNDDGPGFDYERAVRGGSVGLESMHFHANLIGAKVEIMSQVNIGTRVTIRVRIEKKGVSHDKRYSE